MSDGDKALRLILEPWFDERAAFEIEAKGWFRATVETPDGRRYLLNFYDPVRLQQSAEWEFGGGQPCFAEAGLVIIPKVTVEAMERCLEHLWRTDFLSGLVPMPPTQNGENEIR